MTVSASPADVPGIHGNGVGKGQSLLNAIAALPAVAYPATVSQRAVKTQLGVLQINAVDYFMASYWVSADSILATMTVNMQGADKHVFDLQAKIAARLLIVATIPPAVQPAPLVYGNEAPQYSAYMPPFPLTPPDGIWYALCTELVGYCMAKGILPAGLILSTMTGSQTYPYTYNTNGQVFSPDGEGDQTGDL